MHTKSRNDKFVCTNVLLNLPPMARYIPVYTQPTAFVLSLYGASD